MVCFCKQSAESLQLAVRAMASENFTLSAQSAASLRVTAVANWLAARGLPQAPWSADPAWLELVLPAPKLSLSAMATLSAMAQLNAQVKLAFNIDLLAAGSATPLVRLVATLNARLSAMLSASIDLNIDASAWLTLAAELEAAVSVTAAASLNLFAPSPSLLSAYLAPGGIELSLWAPFLDAIAALSPLIALRLQLGIADSVSLAAAIRMLNAIEVPALVDLSATLSLVAALSAVARLQATLGVNVLEAGLASISAMVALRVEAALALIPPSASPPRISICPTLIASPPVVAAAASAEIALLADLDWKVPDLSAVASLGSLLPALSLSAQMSAALTMPAIMLKPCASGCDAASLMRLL
jgi:hypothetical protein